MCVNDSRRLSDAHLNFIRSHPLMDAAVPALHGRPLLVRTSLRERFTSIAVDSQVRAADGTAYDVLFVGTGAQWIRARCPFEKNGTDSAFYFTV